MTTPVGRVFLRSTRTGSSREARQTCPDEECLTEFLGARPRLFGVAYRILGSAAEAEDVVQDVWVRWQTADRRAVRNASVFLATATARLAINVLRSARSRHETYVEPWQHEPVDTQSDARSRAERSEALACAVLVLLEKLSPAARVAYVLREAFEYSYRKIADSLRIEEANARQLVTRARQRVAEGRGLPATSAEQGRLLTMFVSAVHRGDIAALLSWSEMSHPAQADASRMWREAPLLAASASPESSEASLDNSGAA